MLPPRRPPILTSARRTILTRRTPCTTLPASTFLIPRRPLPLLRPRPILQNLLTLPAVLPNPQMHQRTANLRRLMPRIQQPLHRVLVILIIPLLQHRPQQLKIRVRTLALNLLTRRHLMPLHMHLRVALNPLHQKDLTPAHQTDRLPTPPRAPCPSNPVHIIFLVIRQINVHHQIQVIHVQSPRRHIRRHQHLHIAIPEILHHPVPQRLVQVTMQPVHRKPPRHQRIRHIVHHPLRVREQDRQPRILNVQQPAQHLHLRPAVHLVIPLLDRRHRQRLVLNLHPHRIRRVTLNQMLDRPRKRRREKDRLPVLRHHLHHPVDLILETHVQHLIRLVKDQRLQVVQTHQIPLNEINHPSWCSHHDLRPGLQSPNLPVVRRPTINRRRLHPRHVRRQLVNLLAHLDRQLPCRTQNQHLHIPLLRLQPLQRRNRKRHRLPRPRLRLPHHIPPLDARRNRLRLHRCRLFEAQRFDRF